MIKRYNEEANLIRLCKKGDLTALAHIARQHRAYSFQIALNLLGTRELASELVIVTFVRFWNDRQSIKTNTSLKTYFLNLSYTIAKENPGLFEVSSKRKLEMEMLNQALKSRIAPEIIGCDDGG